MRAGRGGGAAMRWRRMSAAGSGSTPEMAALGVVEMVDENMANAARVHAIESGKTYEGRTLIAFGGGGPVHACRVAEKIGIDARAGAVRCRRRQRHRLPARAVRLRGGAQPLSALVHLRRRGGQRAARRDGRQRRRRSSAQGSLGAADRAEPHGLYALCRAGARNPGAAARARARRGRCRRRSAPPTTPNTPASTTGRCPAPMSRL